MSSLGRVEDTKEEEIKCNGSVQKEHSNRFDEKHIKAMDRNEGGPSFQI
jgi:hypothetical protein